MRTIFVLLLGLSLNPLWSQHENDTWFFGEGHAGMLYNGNYFQSYSIHMPLNGEGCGVATDPLTGELLFYTDGEKIFDRTHNPMVNGQNLGGDPSSAQAVAIVPVPGGCNSYLVFSNGKSGISGPGDLFYSIVDMNLNNGLGAVTIKKQLLRSNVKEGMLTISRPGTSDFWLVGADDNPGVTFYVFPVTANGVGSAVGVDLGPDMYTYCLSYSEKAGKIAASYPDLKSIFTYGFDANTGAFNLSSDLLIDGNIPSSYDSEWSADGTKLYYSSWTKGPLLRQYDFNTGNTSYLLTDTLHKGGGLKIGPDNAVYFISDHSSNYLSRIAFPDLPGTTCSYQSDNVDLGAPVKGLNLPITLTPVSSVADCIRPIWEARVTSNNNYIEPAEPWCEVVANGQAWIPPSNVDTNYYWSNFLARLPADIRISGEISLECRIRNSSADGGIDGYDVGLNLSDGFKSAYVNFIGSPASMAYTKIAFGDQDTSNLPELLTNFEDWNTLRLDMTATNLRASINGNTVFTFPHTGSLCWLSYFNIWTKGSGRIDWVRLYDAAGQEVYYEEFNASTPLACLNAQPASENFVNRYAALTDLCGNLLTVSAPTAFAVGDTVLLIQMQGATVDTTETPTCGNFLDYGNAGHYELNLVEEVQGNQILLRNKIQQSYDIPGKVQLVYVPNLSNSETGCLTCPAWNGSTGGILAFTGGDITLQGDINVSGKGFAGGPYADGVVECPPFNLAFHYPASAIDSAGAKGSGLSALPNIRARGKGAQGNGGGGGNGHNNGGGAGGNGGDGGRGGAYQYPCQPLEVLQGGFGGKKIYRDNTGAHNRAVMGGGGGAGHSNNEEGSPGGNGGGIVLAWVNKFIAGGYAIRSNGQDAPGYRTYPDNNDGGSGGGAGGSIMLMTNNGVSGNLLLEAKGGNGTDVQYDHGHGGGGGGGVVWVNTWPPGNNVQAIVTGGRSGIGVDNKTNGATNGENGQVLTGLNIPFVQEKFVKLHLDYANINANCDGTGTLDAIASGGSGPILYSTDGLVWTNTGQVDSLPEGVVALWITDGCMALDTLIDVITFSPIQLDKMEIGPQICVHRGTLSVAASGGAPPLQYLLDDISRDNGQFSDLPGVSYTLLIRDSIGCEFFQPVEIPDLSYSIPIQLPDTVTFYFGNPVQLIPVLSSSTNATLLAWQWKPASRVDCANCQNTLAHPLESTLYMVELKDTFGCTGKAQIVAQLVGTNIYRPSIFSANQPFYWSCDESVARIRVFQAYDRWGALVAEISDAKPDAVLWDGTIRGRPATPGVYIYLAEVELTSGLVIKIKGDVTFLGSKE